MNRVRAERGGAPIFLMVALVLSCATGYGVYRLIKQHRRETAIAEANAPAPRPVSAPPEEKPREPDPMPVEEPPAQPSLETARAGAIDPPESDRGFVAFGTPGIDGPLPRYRIEQAVKTQKAKFMRCLALTETMDMGVLQVTLLIGTDGKLTAKALSEGGEAEFRKCIEEGIDRLVFDPAERPTVIVYPIRFSRPRE